MRWLADECIETPLIDALRKSGHDVTFIAHTEASASDIRVLEIAAQSKRLLITDDKDFGELIIRYGHDVPGMVLMRIDPANASLRLSRLLWAIEQFGENLFGHYTIIDEKRVRVRSLPRNV